MSDPTLKERNRAAVAVAAAVLAFFSWSAWSVWARQPSFLAAVARCDEPFVVALVSTSITGEETRVTRELSASPTFSSLRFPLPEAEIGSLQLELPSGSGPLHLERLELLDRRGELARGLPYPLLKPLGATRMTRGATATELSSADAGEGASLRIEVGFLYAGGRHVDALLWTLLGVALLGVALSFPGSPLPRLLTTPARQRAAAALVALVVLGCSAAMARASRVNAHPDESSHLSAAEYYAHEWLPAPIGDPRLEPTLIPGWSKSYLFEPDVVYFPAGKLAWLTGLPVASASRLLQWLLLAGLLALAVWHVPSAPALALVCALTPQAWYVFSYFNGDAWPLAFALVAGLILVNERLPACLLGDERPRRLRWALALGLVLGILLVSKANYIVFVAWSLAVLALRLREAHGGVLAARPLRALALVCAPALLVFALRTGYEQAINGFERGRRIEAFVEAHSEPRFLRANNLAGQGMPNMYLHAKGRSIAWLIEDGWLVNSIDSALGLYGPNRLRAPDSYYPVAGSAVLAVVAALALATWRSRAPGSRMVLALLLAGVFVVVAQSIWFSWTYSSQPQGRYLFPILPMLVVALAPGAKLVPGRILALLTLCPLGLSLWSFVAIGLERIAR